MSHQTDSERLLDALRRGKGDWVGHLYRDLGVMVHSRIADLRKRGYVIECRCFGPGDYRYRLVGEPGAPVPPLIMVSATDDPQVARSLWGSGPVTTW